MKTQWHTRRTPWRKLQDKKMQTFAGKPKLDKTRKKRAWPHWQLHFRVLASRTLWWYICCCLSHPVCGILLQQSQGANTHSLQSLLRNSWIGSATPSVLSLYKHNTREKDAECWKPCISGLIEIHPTEEWKGELPHSEDLWRAQEIHSEIGSVCNEEDRYLSCQISPYAGGSSSVIPGLALSSSSLQNLSCKITGPHSRPTKSETLEVGSHHVCFNKFSRRF